MNVSKSNLKLFLYAAVVLLTGFSGKSFSKTIFVSTNGSITNSGFTISDPLNSINQAVSNASAGDTIFILPGTYKEIINIDDKNGSPESSIHLVGYTVKGNYPVIDGGAEKPLLDGTNDWMYIQNSSWISISKIKFEKRLDVSC